MTRSLADSANPDPSVFFSTAALLMGVLITITGASLAQIILNADQAVDTALRSRRRINIFILTSVTLIDIWGVGYPFWALYQSALGHISSGVVKLVFISTIVVAACNVILPYYLISYMRGARYWYNIFRLLQSPGEERGQEIRKLLTEGGYIGAEEFDDLIRDIKSGTLTYEKVVRLSDVLCRAFVLASPRGVSSPTRTFLYYYFRVATPFVARQIMTQIKAESERKLEEESETNSDASATDDTNESARSPDNQ